LRLADIVWSLRTARHDINNPLATALVETQLLLMDVTEEETRRALIVIQEELRRIRDLILHLRVPGPPGPVV
jgi:signal transduction histidine kinase